jgi:hypothetical protein
MIQVHVKSPLSADNIPIWDSNYLTIVIVLHKLYKLRGLSFFMLGIRDRNEYHSLAMLDCFALAGI